MRRGYVPSGDSTGLPRRVSDHWRGSRMSSIPINPAQALEIPRGHEKNVNTR
jgi:hypothetical protein